jgi:hypothetical protein
MVLGQICLQDAEALHSRKRSWVKLAPIVDEGLRAVEKSLALAPGLPRALALQGVLSLRSAELASDLEKKKVMLERAQEALAQGFKGTPLLKRRYEEAAALAAELAKGL